MSGSLWGTTPRLSIESACRRLGADTVISGCVTLLEGGGGDPELVAVLAGPAAPRFLDAPPAQRYWLRVWGARGLLWSLSAPVSPAVTGALIGALGDEHWRVREMTLRVVARHRLDDAQPAVAALIGDDTPRVRTCAARTLRLLSTP